MCALVNVAIVVCDACNVCARIEWMLPTFEGESFYNFLSARMHNFILHSIKDKGWMPLYYYPANEEVISADNVACFFKEKGWRWVAGENKDGSPMPSTDTGLLQYNSFD